MCTSVHGGQNRWREKKSFKDRKGEETCYHRRLRWEDDGVERGGREIMEQSTWRTKQIIWKRRPVTTEDKAKDGRIELKEGEEIWRKKRS